MSTTKGGREETELFIVSENITKEKAYFGQRDEELRRVAQGVYVDIDADFRSIFQIYGIRLARRFFPQAVLTHCTAWYLKPTDDRVFVGGDYPYKKMLVEGDYEARIVQSTVRPDIADERLYRQVQITDPLGTFDMWCATPELLLLQQMDATKVNPEKHMPEPEVLKVWRQVKKRYGGRGHAWDVLEDVARAAGKRNEANRFFNRYYRDDE